MQEGDSVFVIAGNPTPMVLRPVEGHEKTYEVVGAALVLDVMHDGINDIPSWEQGYVNLI